MIDRCSYYAHSLITGMINRVFIYFSLVVSHIPFYYINTSEIPSELSRENFISSHVKITCYLHT